MAVVISIITMGTPIPALGSGVRGQPSAPAIVRDRRLERYELEGEWTDRVRK